MAENLAYATLLQDGFNVRISGEDVERGTFSHRHAVLKLEDSEEEYIPMNSVPGKKGRFAIYNSHLSEYAVLGFDYGYAMASPETLVIWEAQFGDFANGAQIIIDQFISAAEDKWKTQNGLVMLFRTDTKAKVPSTPQPASSAFCSFAPKTTWPSATRLLQLTTSTCCAAACTGASVSR
jgi:2-oxoglutarate dehydrogenase complex dehydrogenase (E1) component-like enzyme